MLPFCDCFYAEPVNGCVFEVSRLLLPLQSVFGLMSNLVGWIINKVVCPAAASPPIVQSSSW
jgi:hypothetical protein